MKSSVKPNLVFDARMVDRIPHGIARLAVAISEILLERAAEFSISILVRDGAELPAFFDKFKLISCQSPFLSPRAWMEIPPLLRRERATLYFNPGFESFPTLPCPHVQIVHDLNHLHFGALKEKIYYRTLLRQSMQRSRAVGAVSRFACAEIESWMEWKSGRVLWTPNVVEPRPKLSEDVRKRQIESLQLDSTPFMLCLSNPKPHKNLEMLVAAWADASLTRSQLVLTINAKDLPDPLARAKGVQFLGPVSDLQAQALQESCTAFYFPSLYEGQGLPPIEAAWAGAPTVASAIGPHLEAMEGISAIRFVDPRDRKGWAEAFRSAERGELTPPLRTELENTVGRNLSKSALRNALESLCFSVLRSQA